MSANTKASLTTGPIPRTLFKLGGPMMIGIVAMMAFNLVDTYFVGKLGTIPLAAMVLTFPVIMAIASFALGLGAGTVAVVSRAIGQQDTDRIKRLTTDSLTLALLFVTFFVILGYLAMDPLFRLVGATSETMPYVKQYMRVWFPGMVFVVIPMVGNNAIRATGDTLTPSAVMIVAVLVNGILDPLLIFGIGPFPRMGLGGAALATVMARGTTFVVAVSILHFRERMLTWPFPGFKILSDSYRGILKVGLPVALSNILIPITLFIVTRIVSQHGPGVIAGFGVASRIEAFSMTVIFAFSVGLSPFVGQNLGAGRVDRVEGGIWFAVRLALVWGGVVVLVLLPFGRGIATLFNSAPDAVSTAALYLTVLPLTLGLKGVHQLSWASLNVLDRASQSLLLEILHGFVLTVPLAFLGSRYFGFRGVLAAMATANVLGGITGVFLLRNAIKKIRTNTVPLTD